MVDKTLRENVMEISQLPAGFSVTPAIGLGCWGMSDAYGPADEKESIATIEAALTVGLRHFDTADVYGNGHNETLLGRALAGRRQEVFLVCSPETRKARCCRSVANLARCAKDSAHGR